MNSPLDQPPTRVQQWVGISLAIVATVVCGLVAVGLWTLSYPKRPPVVAASLFTVLFLASAFLLYRAAGTAPKALSAGKATVVAWVFLFLGGVCLLLSIAPSNSLASRAMLLGCGFSGISYGIVGVAKRPRK